MDEKHNGKVEAAFQKQAAARGQQDPKIKFLIHRDNARLIPNVGKLKNHPKLVPYTGSVKASLEDRLRWLRTGGSRRVVASAPVEELPPFDVSTATKEELIAFAKEEFGLELNPKAPPHIMRNQILAAAKAADEGSDTTAVADAAAAGSPADDTDPLG